MKNMAIRLFRHNQTAYNAAVAMFAETEKAAVIYRTGTGKSFIGFKFCKTNPDNRILWLSLSGCIFKTQLENLAEVSDGWHPDRKMRPIARLFVYHNMSKNEMQALKPDIIIMDGFYRVGAES